MSKKKIKGLNEGHYLEATDRAYIVANMMEDVLIEHPVFIKHKELRKRIKKAQKLVLEAYQLIASVEAKEFPKSKFGKAYAKAMKKK
jgi:hypothetical protein